MSLWIVSAALIAVPLVLTLRGAGLLALLVSGAVTFGLYLATTAAALFVLPPAVGVLVAGFLTGAPRTIDTLNLSSIATVALGGSARRAAITFLGLSLFLLAWRRATPPARTRTTTAFYWGLHLSFTGIFIACAVLYSATPSAPDYGLADPAIMALPTATVLASLTLAQVIFTVCLGVIIGRDSFKRRRAHAV